MNLLELLAIIAPVAVLLTIFILAPNDGSSGRDTYF